MSTFKKFIPLTKVEEQADGSLFVYGEVTAERPDLTGEVCHYDTTAPLYRVTAERFKKATSLEGMETKIMPLRYMHQLETCGAGKSMDFDDAAKVIKMGFRVYNDDRIKAVDKVKTGQLSGFSHGGNYCKTWKQIYPGDGKEYTYYTADIGEVSLVDSPCLPTATFEYIKADGSKELRKFAPEIAKATEPAQQVSVPAAGAQGTVINIFANGNGGETEAATTKTNKRGKKVHKANENGCDCSCESCQDDDCGNCSNPECDDEDCDGCPMQKAAAPGNMVKGLIAFAEATKTRQDVTELLVKCQRVAKHAKIKDEDKKAAKAKVAAAVKALSFDKAAWESERDGIIAAAAYNGKCVAAGIKCGLGCDLIKVGQQALAKSLWDVKDMAGVLMTLGYIHGSLKWERDMEGDNSAAPEDLSAIMADIVEWFKELVNEETSELLAATSGNKGEKAMDKQELAKMFNELVASGDIQIAGVGKAHGAATHIHKAQSAVTNHVEKSVGAHTMHKEAMGKAFGAMKEACKALTGDALDKSTDAITKAEQAVNAHCDKMCKAAESHGDTMDGHLGSALKAMGASPSTQANTDISTDNEPKPCDPISQGPTTGKGVTMEDLNKRLEESNKDLLKSMAVLVGLGGGSAAVKVEPATGVGDRSLVVKGTQPAVHQGGVVVVTPEQDITKTNGNGVVVNNGGNAAPADVNAMTPAQQQELARKAFVENDPAAILAFSKLRKVADSVPSHLQSIMGARR